MESDKAKIIQKIKDGKMILGIELGSTRIKAVLTDDKHVPVASGSYEWENHYENNIWTYHMEDVWTGIQKSYQKLAGQIGEEYNVPLLQLGAIGFSAMMHGYLVFDREGNQLVPFRTWRNTITDKAAQELTGSFRFNIPQRWSISHLYQAILNKEEHIRKIYFLTTLSGYVHWRLTGKKVLGIGDASGIFPVDSCSCGYSENMLQQFDGLIADKNIPWKLKDILPEVLRAGDFAGTLTEEGARLLDVMGQLMPGVPLCPPEGDAGTGMAATNSMAVRTGNVSAGTSVFAMIVLERELSQVYPEIDMVMTPSGRPVAMVHCNNCTSDLDAWIGLFMELTSVLGNEVNKSIIYDRLYGKALEGDADCGGLLAYNYYSGEQITHMEEGRPLFMRTPYSRFTLANFMRVQLYSAIATLKLGMDILFEKEHVCLEKLMGHGGFFKTKSAGQKLMANAINVPVAVMENAGEGGAWGIALLAAYMKNKEQGETLEGYLGKKVFAGKAGSVIKPDSIEVQGFESFIKRYTKGLTIERAAVASIK
ncbi:sugar (pentulose or hexulose) kinase [Ruminiclostridium sufflavum DSM 19573]|uniref:Sugar (Pentulose or hexulose) kinase n=1 Tax=Ruminiclostridium sufflavum DSM 19573 TaxID=1121337 RepID=A0A318XN13_9FIRM|nr:FGGY-family carbohydrate kinase [Ruminiclostridium sufflavum]PYG89392.1 sugar (pentulose or hexulose) kinase [Ruminiclostridium sufflavum DSM 19573]